MDRKGALIRAFQMGYQAAVEDMQDKMESSNATKTEDQHVVEAAARSKPAIWLAFALAYARYGNRVEKLWSARCAPFADNMLEAYCERFPGSAGLWRVEESNNGSEEDS